MSPQGASVVRLVWPWPTMAGVVAGGLGGLLTRNVWFGVVLGLAVAGVVITIRAVTKTSPSERAERIDPFTVGEPWRQYVQDALQSQLRFQHQIEATEAGPISDYLIRVSDDLNEAVGNIWSIAQAGNRTTSGIRQLDPTGLRAKLDRLKAEQSGDSDPNLAESIASVEAQIASVDRLERQSADTASRLRLDVTRLDELVSNAVLVSTGELPQQRYDSDVSELVRSLQALNSATEDLRSP